jgi:hypothetical protein
MKFCILLVLLVLRMRVFTVDVGLSEIRYHDDAPVVLSELVEAVVPSRSARKRPAGPDPAFCRASGHHRAQGCES